FLCFDADGMMVLTHEGLLHVAAGVLRRRSPDACAMRRDWAADQRVISNPASSISMMRSRAKRASTHKAPWTHCQGSETTLSSSHWRAASFSGRIEMTVPWSAIWKSLMSGVSVEAECLDASTPVGAWPV